jgi:ribosomal protein L7/L12
MNVFDYCKAHHHYFWLWEDDTQVVALVGGSTVAYRDLAAELLLSLAEKGLPPFGSFLMAMTATNQTMDDAIDHIKQTLIAELSHIGKENLLDSDFFGEAFEFLQTLQAVPSEFKQGKNRQILLTTIFSESHNRINISTSKGIALMLHSKQKNFKRLDHKDEWRDPVFIKDFRVMALLKRTFPTVQSVIDAMGELPEPDQEIILLPGPTASPETYNDFVEELLDIPQTFQVAALIKLIWAGFNLPIFNAHPSEQPLGGVSDLSNKGDFDQLLLSEFANDDLIFMNRLANNEALYMHREMPPVKDDLHRTVLIDISLKSWGTPKILSYASYVAIARHPRATGACKAFVTGEHYSEISCNTSADIIEALQKTDAGLHAAKGLTSFLETYKKDKQLELFYLTTPDALKHPEVQKLLAENREFFRYIITSHVNGELNFYQFRNGTQRHLQTIRLPLNKLWVRKNKDRKIELRTAPAKKDTAVRIPLLLPDPADVKKQLPLQQDVYCVANRCLLKRVMDSDKIGWELMLKDLPGNSLYEVGTADGQVLLLCFNLQNKELSITNLDTGMVAKSVFEQWRSTEFREFLYDGYGRFLYLLGNPDVLEIMADFAAGIIRVKLRPRNSEVFARDYPQRQKQIKILPPIYPRGPILKKIAEVYINESNYLVFNGHQLVLDSRQLLIFNHQRNTVMKHVAQNPGNKRLFVFKDGSKIQVDPAGYVTLLSSNINIEPIYINTQLEGYIGAATKKEFAGNEFFFNACFSAVKLTLKNPGAHILAVIKQVREHTGMSLSVVSNIVNSWPVVLTDKMNFEAASKLAKDLEEAGADVMIERNENVTQDIVSCQRFYLDNIATFINNIITS